MRVFVCANIATMGTKPPIPATRSAMTLFGGFLANMLPQIIQNSRAIAFIRGRLLPGAIPQQTTEVKKDVEVHSKGKPTSSRGHENKPPIISLDISYKSRDETKPRRARDTFAGSALRNATTKRVSVKVKGKINLGLLIALAIITLPPGAEGCIGPERCLQIQMGQSVTLSADAKVEDTVVWSMSPENNSAEYSTIYHSSKPNRDPGCGGYQFQKTHSIFIANAQPCHAGTYTAEIFKGNTQSTIVLILKVSVTTEVSTKTTALSDTIEVSTETTNLSETTFYLAANPASDTDSKTTTTIILAVLIVFTILLTITAVTIAILFWTGKCKCMPSKAPANGSNDGVSYSEVRSQEVA